MTTGPNREWISSVEEVKSCFFLISGTERKEPASFWFAVPTLGSRSGVVVGPVRLSVLSRTLRRTDSDRLAVFASVGSCGDDVMRMGRSHDGATLSRAAVTLDSFSVSKHVQADGWTWTRARPPCVLDWTTFDHKKGKAVASFPQSAPA